MNDNIVRKAIFRIRDRVLPRHTGLEAQETIRKALESDEPLMIARFGAVEVKAVLYGILPPPINICLENYVYSHMGQNAGFFPVNSTMLERFKDLMLHDMADVDILASWRPEEIFFKKRMPDVYRIGLMDLQPHENSDSLWTAALREKKVLVVHPFAKTIERQYNENRTRLFKNRDILPEFASLTTIAAVQSIAGNRTAFANWFDALAWMEEKIDCCEFDVALIGCGAYGFPLAAYCKRIGKKAIHVGGALQLIFGIKGKRWDNWSLYNEYWVSPSEAERPEGLQNVEGGCYW